MSTTTQNRTSSTEDYEAWKRTNACACGDSVKGQCDICE